MVTGPERELDLPGTVHIFKDTYGEGNENLLADGNIILIPQPSDSVNDPLNWAYFRKVWHATLLFMIVGLTAATSNSASAAQQGMIDKYGFSWGIFNTGAGVLFAGIGYWTVLTGPSVSLWGSRISYIVGGILGIGGSIWYACTGNVGDAIASQLFVGASESVAEAMVQNSLSQIFFLHQMPHALAWYVLATSVGTFLGPLIGGYAADNLGWPWVGGFGAICGGVILFLTIFALEETYFDRAGYIKRSLAVLRGLAPQLSPGGQAQVEDKIHGLELRSQFSPLNTSNQVDEEEEVSSGLDTKHKELTDPKSIVSVSSTEAKRPGPDASLPASPPSNSDSGNSVHDAENRAGLLPPEKRKTYWQQMALITPAANLRGWGFKQYAKRFFLIMRVFAFPAVIYSGLQWGAQDAWLTFYITLESDWWSEPPYNYGDAGVAIMNVPTLIGAIIGCLYGSYFSDYIGHLLAKRNNGIFEAEFRLYAMFPCLILSPLGMFLLGVGTEHGWAWPVPYVGLGFIGFGFGCAGDLSMGYVVDCYPDMVLEGFIGVSAINNSLGMIFSFVCSPWMEALQPQNTFISVGVLDFFFLALTIPVIIWGKQFRKWTRNMYESFVDARDSMDQ